VALLHLLFTSSIIMANNSFSELKLAGKTKEDNEASKSDKSEAKMQGRTLEDLEKVTGGMTWVHVMVLKAHQSLQNKVITKIGKTIASHPAFRRIAPM
jgi:hypothetical protein